MLQKKKKVSVWREKVSRRTPLVGTGKNQFLTRVFKRSFKGVLCLPKTRGGGGGVGKSRGGKRKKNSCLCNVPHANNIGGKQKTRKKKKFHWVKKLRFDRGYLTPKRWEKKHKRIWGVSMSLNEKRQHSANLGVGKTEVRMGRQNGWIAFVLIDGPWKGYFPGFPKLSKEKSN